MVEVGGGWSWVVVAAVMVVVVVVVVVFVVVVVLIPVVAVVVVVAAAASVGWGGGARLCVLWRVSARAEKGRGVERSPESALRRFVRACELGNRNACFTAGVMTVGAGARSCVRAGGMPSWRPGPVGVFGRVRCQYCFVYSIELPNSFTHRLSPADASIGTPDSSRGVTFLEAGCKKEHWGACAARVTFMRLRFFHMREHCGFAV